MSALKTRDLQEAKKLRERLDESIKIYREYKRLREGLGKSPRTFNDREAILKDLLGEGFSVLEKEIERAKGNKKTRRTVYTKPHY